MPESKNMFNKLEVKNGNETDAIICLTEYSGKKRTIRNEYIRAGETFIMTNIPNGTYYIKSFSGKDWNPDTLLYDGKIKGFFDSNRGFSKSDKKEDLLVMKQNEKTYSHYTITLYKVKDGNMESEYITIDNFFE